jgi:hypothetical protein
LKQQISEIRAKIESFAIDLHIDNKRAVKG